MCSVVDMEEQTSQLDLNAKLHELFGFAAFRDGQENIVRSVLEGRDALAVMPTGSGKSLCYQFPACLLDGVTLVVSPLIALMKDQVDAALERGLSAVAIHSGQQFEEQRRALKELGEGSYDLVYVAPERFANAFFQEALSKVKVSLLAVDEAHCISQWGHDFRPDYLNLGEVRDQLGSPTTLALTATATPEVQNDILSQLEMPKARVIVSGFERENLFFEVFAAGQEHEKSTRLVDVLDQVRGQSSVIYCATRKQVEEIRARVEHAGHVVGTYHGGLSDARRSDVQDAFMAGDIPVLVATNAFGMGVDKPDVRAIIHFNLPGSVEAYYQEAGRAGRDGEPARCVLLYHPADRGIHEFFIDLSFPTPDVVMAVWAEVRRYGVGTHALGAEQICEHINRSSKKKSVIKGGVEAALRLLKSAMHLDFGWRDGFPWIEVLDHARGRDLRIDWDHVTQRREIATRQLEDSVRYARGAGCRQAMLLKYFKNESVSQECGHCDRCCTEVAWDLVSPAYQGKGARVVTEESMDTIVRKALSGVARIRGRGGLHRVSAMLRGSKSRLVLERQLNELSTYGLLDYMTPAVLIELLEACERFRLVVRSSRGYLSLTEEGVSVMRGEESIPSGLSQRLAKSIQQK